MQAERLQLRHLGQRKAPHAVGQVLARLLDDEPRRPLVTDQPERVARNGEPDLDLGADRDPLDEWPQCVRQERVLLVATVVTDLRPEQAGGDAEPDLFALAFGHRVH